MPSEYQKKKLAKKKEAAKQKGGKKATTNNVEENGVNGASSNGVTPTASGRETRDGSPSTNGQNGAAVNGASEVTNGKPQTTYEGKVKNDLLNNIIHGKIINITSKKQTIRIYFQRSCVQDSKKKPV